MVVFDFGLIINIVWKSTEIGKVNHERSRERQDDAVIDINYKVLYTTAST